ncbi:MAG: aldo/keto reductase [Chloroflexi bacterium]|nr:aldo/keto reductase [Chloroflexota bacterium]MQC17916.1 aldo/keto reductase [Chloroflexota bacterium]
MEHVRLGRIGLQVSRLCLGTMNFGLQCDEVSSIAILDHAAEGGIDFIDTADSYPWTGDTSAAGRTESILGRWLAGRRHEFVVATKGYYAVGPKPWDRGNSRKHVMDAVDASLGRLQTDYVDLYQLHAYDPATPIEETLRALEDIVRSGRARYVGVSNWLAYQLARANGKAETLGLTALVAVQPRYNLLSREAERGVLPLALEDGLGVIPYSPLAGGLLTGKHLLDAPAEGSRFARAGSTDHDRYWQEHEFETVEDIRLVADEAGLPMTQMAISWVLANPAITAPIIGASRPEQLQDSISATEEPLPPDVKERLDDITEEYRLGDAAL